MSTGLYVKLDANFFSDDRIVEVEPLAQLVYLRILCLCKRTETDGRFSWRQIQRECGDISGLSDYIDELDEYNLIYEVDGEVSGTYQVTAWLSWNKSKAWLDEYRKAQAEHGRKGGRPKAETAAFTVNGQ